MSVWKGLWIILYTYRVISPLINDHLPKHIRNFAAIGGYSLLWPEETTFLRHRRAYLRPEVAIVACGLRPQGFISHKSQPTPGRMLSGLSPPVLVIVLGEVFGVVHL